MDIVIVRDGEEYRLLHGHLRLANMLREARDVVVHVRGEGELRVGREHSHYVVLSGSKVLPLRMQ